MLAAFGLALAGCNAGNFEAESKVDTVRILGSMVDQPYAKPGATVTMSVLAFDGRPSKPEPMGVWWLPVPCINPMSDEYYQCFQQLAGGGGPGGDAGTGTGPGKFGPGVDLTPYLTAGTSFTFTLPPDIITSHPAPIGVDKDPYGLAIAFNMACAGHIEIVPRDPNNLSAQQVPVGCFDKNEKQLGADAWVLGFTRVYAYNDRTNMNPVLQAVVFNHAGIDTTAGVTVTHCSGCPDIPLDVTIPPSSQEVNPGDLDSNGNPRKEQVWVDYFASVGDLADDARLIFDPTQGAVLDTATDYSPPGALGDGMMWAVVHDNRGGAAWAAWPAHVK